MTDWDDWLLVGVCNYSPGAANIITMSPVISDRQSINTQTISRLEYPASLEVLVFSRWRYYSPIVADILTMSQAIITQTLEWKGFPD